MSVGNPYFRLTLYRDGGARLVHISSGADLEVCNIRLDVGHDGHTTADFTLGPGMMDVEMKDGTRADADGWVEVKP